MNNHLTNLSITVWWNADIFYIMRWKTMKLVTCVFGKLVIDHEIGNLDPFGRWNASLWLSNWIYIKYNSYQYLDSKIVRVERRFISKDLIDSIMRNDETITPTLPDRSAAGLIIFINVLSPFDWLHAVKTNTQFKQKTLNLHFCHLYCCVVCSPLRPRVFSLLAFW